MSFDFVLVQTKKSGNYTIHQKDSKKIRMKLCNVYIPFGREEYNDNLVLNVVINNKSNYGHNSIVQLKHIAKKFQDLRNTYVGKIKYNIESKNFFDFMTKLENTEISDQTKINQENDGQQSLVTDKPVDEYIIRTYLKHGVHITHKKLIGNLEINYDLKQKYCDIEIELGSMWINEETNKYGINIYVNSISVY